MVKYFQFLLLGMLFAAVPLLGQVEVTAEIDQTRAVYAGRPLIGTLTVTHRADEVVDPGSATLDGTSLALEKIREVAIDPKQGLRLSIYRFELEPKEEGLYTLPSIQVKVGGKRRSTIPSTIQVEPLPVKPTLPQSSKKKEVGAEIHLELKASADPKSRLYPGQQTRLVYLFLYSGDIELTREDLPMLDAEGLRKVGKKEIFEGEEGGLSTLQVVQRVEGVRPGTFTFGPSVLEGRGYVEDAIGNRSYIPDLLRSEAPSVTIEVLPFPEKNKPASFEGAVGSFSIELKLLSPPKVRVEEKILLAMTVRGEGSFEHVHVPGLCCQPGFSGLFREGDLSPPGEDVEGGKRFQIELYPLTTEVREIPSIEFSFFNPQEEAYEVRRSKPIAIEVLAAINPEKAPKSEVEALLEGEGRGEDRFEETKAPETIAIAGNLKLSVEDVNPPLRRGWWVLLLMPLGWCVLRWQKQLWAQWDQARRRVPPRSGLFFDEAMRRKKDPESYFRLIEEALRHLLFEQGRIAFSYLPVEELSEKGRAGDVKVYLEKVHLMRYGEAAEGERDIEDLMDEGSALFRRLQG